MCLPSTLALTATLTHSDSAVDSSSAFGFVVLDLDVSEKRKVRCFRLRTIQLSRESVSMLSVSVIRTHQVTVLFFTMLNRSKKLRKAVCIYIVNDDILLQGKLTQHLSRACVMQ